MSSMVTYEAFVDECIKIFRKRLDEISSAGQPADMAWWFNCFATDTVALLSFSKRLGDLDKGEDVGELNKSLHSNLTYAVLVGIYSEMHRLIFGSMEKLSQWGVSKGTPRGYIQGVVRQTVTERRKMRAAGEKPDIEKAFEEEENAPKDFATKFLDANEQDASRFTDLDVMSGLSSNVIAGADTTAATLSGILYWLLRYPKTLEKLRQEVDEGKAAGRLSTPITFRQAQELRYLQAVIQEAQRMHPAVGLPLERVVPAGGVQLCGYYFPEGSVVGVNAWVLHYDTGVFGPDAAEFRPERWLESDAETLARMNHSHLPFGLGARTCIGKNVSLLEMSKLLPELVHNFNFELAGDLRSGKEWTVKNHWFVIPKSLDVAVSRRHEA
ncbi:hypothetical protein BAUCODRAFT_34036 [Baudoinia panamericana UAMH 10762]|uniref:Uncharacterized protein n=1 Tax=Baudoinia panamericana (strain UAMH 10762) TaxID=717646 RepID=M2MJ10_BAUPA|nr:uncharacterized protein BAUCODRAFT_34036 [Baudoinia panamericana UAMH 10762]EMC96656.1 hypothetical protein BAUCODRAFT_34036 [Baudoinia panamericana UAMH 10762]